MAERRDDQRASKDQSVLIVDEHASVQEGLAMRIDDLDGFVVGGTAGTIREALAMSDGPHFDVAVVDEQLSDGSGLDLCRRLVDSGRVTHCILHAGTEIDPTDAMARGVSAIVLKQLRGTDLLDAIQRVAEPDGSDL